MATRKTSTRKTTSTKSATTRSTTPSTRKAVPAASAATEPVPIPRMVKVVEPEPTPDLRKKELIEQVVDASGLKKRDVKPAVEAALEVLGDMLAKGREMNLPGLGKLRIHRVEEKDSARVIVCRIRQMRTASAERTEDPEFQAG